MKFKKELKALKEKINKVIEHVKEAQVEMCRRDSCNILPDFSKEQKRFSKRIFPKRLPLCLISIILFLFAAAFKKVMPMVVERIKK
ncbi:hypothetical protein [Bartonella sp. AU18XJBT]|uniref:hypothetical protein n=1 Tax=Bartonella sp. AU18XJBT TaxID=3019089 RepID=UPI00235F2E89|nr:hypothetical protein [Bartonella sp. AU18XJBT]